MPNVKLFFLDFPPACVEETTQNCMSWRYIKVAELVELLWRLQSSRRCTLNTHLCLFHKFTNKRREIRGEKLNHSFSAKTPPSNIQAERIDSRRLICTLFYSTYSLFMCSLKLDCTDKLFFEPNVTQIKSTLF